MFFTKKKSLKIDEIENIIGVVLNYRNKFMNIGDVAEMNIYTGGQIMHLSNDQDRLSFEFDSVVVGCLLYTLKSKFEVTDELINKAIRLIFENTDLPQTEKDRYLSRFNEYAVTDLNELSSKFYQKMPNEGFDESWESNAIKQFSKQLGMLQDSLTRFIKDESKAMRSV